ncbi:hypothetical protein Lal_00035006 [Lupinus albus]|nr:hypothetical protein Lal_00035006 [Lupinus albus]
MTLNPSAKFEVEKFDGTGNFGLWQRRVKDMLAQQGLSKALRENKQRLNGLKMQEGTDLHQHLNTFNQVINDLQKLDVKVDDEDKAIILLCSLPNSYEHLVTTLTYGKDSINTFRE